jgi:hypothetical protein
MRKYETLAMRQELHEEVLQIRKNSYEGHKMTLQEFQQ